jgi:hypothetical protein
MSTRKYLTVLLLGVVSFCGCTIPEAADSLIERPVADQEKKIEKIKNSGKVIHVLVALCDNENQGIVPVPANLGNGEDTERNLYWGAAYGVKTYFSKSRSWEKIAEFQNPKPNVLQRIVFRHRDAEIYLVADAYRGSKMKETIDEFFSAVSGKEVENVKVRELTLQIKGSSNLIAFVGHNGLMDFSFDTPLKKADDEKRDAVILACASRNYFAKYLRQTGAEPLLWTTNLMAPEAYVLHDAIEGWVKGESSEQVRVRAASAYAKYQKISQKSAQNLLVTGW